MNACEKTDPVAPSFEGLICASLPSLDPNGQPFSMILRGDAAELGDLRAVLISHPNASEQLQIEIQRRNVADAADEFEDPDVEGIAQAQVSDLSEGFQFGQETNNIQQPTEIEGIVGGTDERAENQKRNREDDGENPEIDDEEEADVINQERLLFYLPSVQCTCSSWKMEDVPGDMLITALRVLFLAKTHDSENQCDNLAIDGSCIALHAVDSLPGENDGNISHHIYCQLVEPMGEESNTGYTSAMSMIGPTEITDENCGIFDENGEDQEKQEEDVGSSEDDGTIELYFKPMISDEEKNGTESQSKKCQRMFDSLTTLASLSPVEDSDGCGGLFSMLSLMAGIGNTHNGFDGEMVIAGQEDESDDDMVVRLGGNNNLVENDNESEGAPDEERQAMLNRLDDMLVVPPEYEIASSDGGQFDDAEEDDTDDEIL